MVYIIFLLPAPASRLHSALPSSHRAASSPPAGGKWWHCHPTDVLYWLTGLQRPFPDAVRSLLPVLLLLALGELRLSVLLSQPRSG